MASTTSPTPDAPGAMHVALLFPAATDPRAPHLAIPSLAAALRDAGVRVTVRDLDIEGLERVTSPDRLADAAARLGPGADPRLVRRADWLVEHTPRAFARLRDRDAFVDPDRHHQARRTIARSLELVSTTRPGVAYSITSADYTVEGIDVARLDDLVQVTADDRHNLFEDLYDDVLADLAADPPALVGISILNRQQVIPALRLARRCREAGWPTVLGGTVYAKFHDALRRRPRFFETFCDALVPYEGETALTALVEAIDAGRGPQEWGDVPNLLSLGPDGRVVAGPTHVEDVSSLPTPDFDGLPLERYLNPEPVLPILTGKGCYFNRCKFCDIPFINRIATKPYRVRDAGQIAGDVATLHQRHGARHFEITDETLSPKLLTRLGEALTDHPGIDPRFVGYARFEPGFTPEACDAIAAMGMRKLFFGLESGNQAMLDHMDKGTRVDVAHEVLRNVTRAGIAVHVFSIVGFPEETEAQARDTLGFLLDAAESLRAPCNTFDVHPFGLDLRTEYGDEPARFGIQIIDPGDTDFPITIPRWRNARGLSRDDADSLLREFTATLRERFRGERAYPDQQWPGYEEYAVVYGDHHDAATFAYRLALPDAGDPMRFCLRVPDDLLVDEVDGGVVVTGLEASRPVHAVLWDRLVRHTQEDTVDGHLDSLTAGLPDAGHRDRHRAEARAVVDGLVADRLLWLRPASAAPR